MSPTATINEDDADGSSLVHLADTLVGRLGVEDALRICRENSWYGVLRLIQGRQNDGMHI